MQQCRQIFPRYSRALHLTFPHGFGKLNHFAIGEPLNNGSYLIERVASNRLLYLSQVEDCLHVHLDGPIVVNFILPRPVGCLKFSAGHAASCPRSKISRGRTPVQIAREPCHLPEFNFSHSVPPSTRVAFADLCFRRQTLLDQQRHRGYSGPIILY